MASCITQPQDRTFVFFTAHLPDMHIPQRSLASLFIFVLLLPCTAQPTLTSGQMARQVGDVFNFLACGPAGFPATGAGLTWYYTNLSGAEGGSVHIVDPAGTVGAPYFPTATAADQPLGFTDAMYYSSTPTEETRLGYYFSAFASSICADPQTEIVYPFTYGSTFTDSMVCAESGVYFRTRYGENTVTCVGYGTVVLPYGTFADCLLLHRHWTFFDDYDQLPPGYVEGDAYSFVKPGIPVPLYSVSYSTYTQGDSTIVNQGSSLLDALSTGVLALREEARGSTLSPNPAHDAVVLHRTSTGPADVSLLSADGRLLASARLSTGAATHRFALAGLPAGIYLVRVIAKGGSTTLRVVKE